MAKAFLKSVAEYVYQYHKDSVDNLCIVLPNKRGALFLKKYLAESFGHALWLPDIISIEELVNQLSNLQVIEDIDLVCRLYESYAFCYGSDAESFESFAKWGQLILQDFNEIDRFLADPKQLYDNLKHIKVIENWSLGEENLSEYQTKYLAFMNSLGPIYQDFTSKLLQQQMAYQGLAYRRAVSNVADAQVVDQYKCFLFCGFNALNAAEIKIMQHLMHRQKAEFLWDGDVYYVDDAKQEAGDFLRQNAKLFPSKDFSFLEDNFSTQKNILVLSVPKQIGQAQAVKQQLQKLLDQGISTDKIAIVLANEKMLWPILKQLPEAVNHVNITMAYPIQYTACYELFDQLIQLQLNFAKQSRQQKVIYHKDLLALLRHPIFRSIAAIDGLNPNWSAIIKQINQRNLAFITQKNLEELFGENLISFRPFLFEANSTSVFSTDLQKLSDALINFYRQQNQNTPIALELEYIQLLSLNFKRLNDLLRQYNYFHTWPAFKQVYVQVIGHLRSPFVGEPLQGLQVMGVLETRTLDFEYLILVNVNEGVLPAGKSGGSFIPNDLKRAFGLPLYSEKDAIYAYHFYRLIQRAKEITITYDSETDTMGKGEKSRFVTQLQIELPAYNQHIQIEERTVVDANKSLANPAGIRVPKNEETLAPILKKALSDQMYASLSPSALTVFKECSLKFYFRYGAQLKETESVEEVAEANTFGSILHRALELIYTDQKGIHVQNAVIAAKKQNIDRFVRSAYLEFFDNKEPVGKNILQEEVIKVYCKKVLDNDLLLVQALHRENSQLQLVDLEKEFTAPLQTNINGINTTVYIKGKIDRIDVAGTQYRIIDYKNSVKGTDKFAFNGFESLFNDSDYNKQFQLLMYAWLLHKTNFCKPEQMLPCIVPLKVFEKEPKAILLNKQPMVLNVDFLNDFESALSVFVSQIFDQQHMFTQTEDLDICAFCAYNTICNNDNR